MLKKIDIVHYHLKPGGVTQIILSQIESLKLQWGKTEIRLLCGECPNPEKFNKHGIELIVNEIFGYADFEESDDKKMVANFQRVKNAAARYFSDDRLVHFHNLNLGKNPYWTAAISELSFNGLKVFNHAHDFSEDRPANQNFMKKIISQHLNMDLTKVMYPDLPNYHIGVLNNHDYGRLKKMGFSLERLHYLPNPVGIGKPLAMPDIKEKQALYETLELDFSKGLVTYPVRVIRRKNIGEFILLNCLFGDRFNFVVTLPPQNKIEVAEYEKWKQFCGEQKINVVFEAGTKVDFNILLGSTDFCLTTSIREGFGMVFLEPWMYGVSVVGRNLSTVTADLQNAGIIFSLLYDEIQIEFDGETMDFSALNFDQQREFIVRLKNDDYQSEKLLLNNPHLKELFNPVDQTTINHNQQIIAEHFSLETYGKRLHDIYSRYDI
jgi:glycosyltransferase involved in cell wall biosynthesis